MSFPRGLLIGCSLHHRTPILPTTFFLHLLLLLPPLFLPQVPSSIQECQDACLAVKAEWQQTLPLLRQMKLPPKFLRLAAWNWAHCTVGALEGIL